MVVVAPVGRIPAAALEGAQLAETRVLTATTDSKTRNVHHEATGGSPRADAIALHSRTNSKAWLEGKTRRHVAAPSVNETFVRRAGDALTGRSYSRTRPSVPANPPQSHGIRMSADLIAVDNRWMRHLDCATSANPSVQFKRLRATITPSIGCQGPE